MLRINQAAGAAAAKSYFIESLDRGDYYLEGQELAGQWGGKAAEELGLSGLVKREDFFALCENLHPQTGERLTLRNKSNRRVGYDINFHAPKEVSSVFALTGDTEILDGFTRAVTVAMQEMEAQMQTRVRKGGVQSDRITGNLAWSLFVHQTARPVGGIPDPHLHAHCFTFNATHDTEEGVWKAGQFGNLKKDAPYYESLFHNAFRRELELAGYRTLDEGKSFKLAEAPAALRDKYSRRTDLIEAEAARKGITDPDRKGELGARTRDRKRKETQISELRREWLSRLDAEEIQALWRLKGDSQDLAQRSREQAQRSVEFAREHAFERESVVSEKQFYTLALQHARARATPEDIRSAASQLDLLKTEVAGRQLVTTKQALAEERAMLDYARKGLDKYAPFASRIDALPADLSVSQRRAAEGVLGSQDGVTLVRGGAGTGKTYLMKAVVAEIERQKKSVTVVAPTTDAAHAVLRKEGFQQADTVQRLLHDPRLQEGLKDQVLWVDEAGLLGTRQMGQVFSLAQQQNARVILTGDDKQHGAVERGGPFALLRQSGVRSVQLTAIRRQQGEYQRIVSKIDRGKYTAAFRDLTKLGWVQEMDQAAAHQQIAREVRKAAGKDKQKQPLVVAPTHKEKNKLTTEIRRELREAGHITGRDRTFPRYVSLGLTLAQRKEAEHYQQGQVIQFNKKAVGFNAGQKTEVLRTEEDGKVVIRGVLNPVVLNTEQADRFDVYEKKELSVAAGDQLRITRNGKAKYGKHALRNGTTHQVDTFEPDTGDIRLTNGWVIPKDFGHLDHAYVTTSFGTQAKGADRVLIAQSTESFGASNARQFYVSVSRGKTSATIYTDDPQKLEEKISQFEKFRNATDAVDAAEKHQSSKPLAQREPDEPRRKKEQREREGSL